MESATVLSISALAEPTKNADCTMNLCANEGCNPCLQSSFYISDYSDRVQNNIDKILNLKTRFRALAYVNLILIYKYFLDV